MRWKQYPAYKTSVIKMVGNLPKHWEERKLKHIASITYSNVDKISVEKETPIRLCNYIDVYNNDHICSELDFMEGTASPAEIAKFKLKKGDVLVTKDSEDWRDIAVSAFVLSDMDNVLCGYHLAQIRSNTGYIIGEFLFRAFFTRPLNDQFRIAATGITRYGLGKYWLDNSLFPVPPKHEQFAIATFLDRETKRIDTLIAKKDRQIELLKEKRSALITHAVTKGVNLNAKMKYSGIDFLAEIPEHWAVMKFAYVAFFQEGPGLRNWQFTDTGVRVICVTNITEKGIDFSKYQKYISEEEYESDYKRFTVKKGDLLLSSSGNSWGKVAEFSLNENVILNTSTIRLHELHKPTLENNFIKWVLQSENVREQLGLMMTGACQPNFGPSHLAKTIVPVPPKDDQQAISSFLDKNTGHIDTLVARVEESIEKLREYRTALISAAVTGKIDVRKEGANCPNPQVGSP